MTSAVQGRPASAGWTAEVRRTLRLALPMVAAYLAELGMWWTDQALVGRLGAEQLAAVGLSGSVLYQGIAVCMGMLSIVAVLVGNAFGAGDPDAVQRAVRQGMRVATVMALGAMIYAWCVPDLLALTGQQPAVVRYAAAYVRPFLFGIAPMLYFTVLRSFVAGVSRPLVVSLITVVAIPLNLGINLVLVFGARVELGPVVVDFAGWGVTGAALGSTLVTWLMLAALAADVLWMPAARPYRVLRHLLRRDRMEWRTIWRLGLPIGLLTVGEGGIFAIISILAGLVGVTTLAANQVTANLVGFGSMVAVGLGEAAAVRVAQEMGAGRPAGARLAGSVAITLGIVVALVLAVPLLAAPDLIAALFLDVADPANAATLDTVARLCAIGALLLVFDCIQIITVRALRGYHDTTRPAWITVVSYWAVALPLSVLLAFPLAQQGIGLWLGLTGGLALAAGWLLLRFARLSRRT